MSIHLAYREKTEFILIGSYKAKLSVNEVYADIDCFAYYAIGDQLELMFETDILNPRENLFHFQAAQCSPKSKNLLLKIPGWKPFQVGISRTCENCDLIGLKPTNSNPETETTNVSLHLATFSLVNFRFIGPSVVDPLPEGLEPGYRLRFGGWQLHVENNAKSKDMTDKFRHLRSSNGYGITHSAKLSKMDGSDFSEDDLIEVIERLRCALTFANGAFVSVLNIEGFNEKTGSAYRNLSLPLSEPWQERINWLDFHETQQLIHYLDCFFQKSDNDPKFFKVVKKAIYWYARSNRNGSGPDGGIIMSAAALERLCSHVTESKSICCGKHKDGCKPYCLIQRTATELKIPLCIKEKEDFKLTLCKQDINRVYKEKKKHKHIIDDLSGLIPNIRNALAHSNNDFTPSVFNAAVKPAWNLAQWLIEEIILHLIGYNYGTRHCSRRYKIPS